MAYNNVNAQSVGQFRPRMQYNMTSSGYTNNGNPAGANNMQNNVSSGQQQSQYGRYAPPVITGNGSGGPQWANQGGYQYNLPNSYGGQGNYYGQQGQGYGVQGQQQGYGGGGGGYYDQGSSQGRPGPSIMSSYGNDTGGQQRQPYGSMQYGTQQSQQDAAFRRGNGSQADNSAMMQEHYSQALAAQSRGYDNMGQYQALAMEQRGRPGGSGGQGSINDLMSEYNNMDFSQVTPNTQGGPNSAMWGQQDSSGMVNNKGAAPIRPGEQTGQVADAAWWQRYRPQSSGGNDAPANDLQPGGQFNWGQPSPTTPSPYNFNSPRRGYGAVGSLGSNRALGGRPGLFQNGYAGGQYGSPTMPLPVAPGELTF